MGPMSLVNASTPMARLSRLIEQAFPLLDSSRPAYALIAEARTVASNLDAYMESCSSPLIVPSSHQVSEARVRAVFKELLQATETTDWAGLYKDGKTKWALAPGMCSGEYEATFLQHQALDLRAENILEIGVFTGTTTLALGLLPRVKKIVALDIEEYLEEFDRPFWKRAGVSDKIEMRTGAAVDSLQQLKRETHPRFDMVFIDADKPSYLTYLNTILDLDLLAPDGVILADNTLYKGYPFADGASHYSPTANIKSNNRSPSEAVQGIREFNDAVRANRNLSVVMLPIRDGITIIRRKI